MGNIHVTRLLIGLAATLTLSLGAIKDDPFPQDLSVKYRLAPELAGAELLDLEVDGDGVVYVLTSKGLARLFEDTLSIDRSYRPLAGQKPLDITTHDGTLFYLFERELFAPGRAGRFLVDLPKAEFRQVAVRNWSEGLLLAANSASLLQGTNLTRLEIDLPAGAQVLASEQGYLLAGAGKAWLVRGNTVAVLPTDHAVLAANAFGGRYFVALEDQGWTVVNGADGKLVENSGTKLPFLKITSIVGREKEVWAGGDDGVFRRDHSGEIRYYAGRRWLDSDKVRALRVDPQGNALVLTATGLNKIEFRAMTLADKARWYEKKIRQRHIRYGLCSELWLKEPGNPASAEMIDTDNDGTWNNYYLAGLAFRYGATRDPEAKRHAWETFEALERLHSINPLEGFPSRTFERRGFKHSDIDRWHVAPDPRWEWKAHTSSDEIIAHAFGCAVLYETAAETPEEKKRIANFQTSIVDHLIANHWQLMDVDGKPTLWGRWNPEYLNHYPHSIVDRRLNSAELVALLQFAYVLSGREIYKSKAEEMLYRHGYLENIMAPMAGIRRTEGFFHFGSDMGSEWNHSDDLLSFVSYWVLHRFALNEELRAKYAATIRDHWEIEKRENNPIWNFVYAATGAPDASLEGAAWILRRFPLDLVSWNVRNSHRQDITKVKPNFRREQLVELLPPSERQMTRWNTQPFILDGGADGHLEYGGDEFLLPYWMGRYLKIIEPPK